MWVRYAMLILAGFSGGVIIAGAFVAFMSMIGIFPKIAEKTKTSKKFMLYENCLILGVTAGNVISLYQFELPVGYIGLILVGLFGGIFTGCLIGALAEVLNVFPILSRRTKIRIGLPYVIVAIAIGKAIGTFIQFYVFK